MGELWSKPTWELILFFIVIMGGLGGLIWLFFAIFKPKHIKIGDADLSNEDTSQEIEKKKIEDKKIKDCLDLKSLQLVVSQSVIVGFEICKLKLTDIIIIQNAYAQEKIEGLNLYLKEQFIKLLHTTDKYKDNMNIAMTDEARLFFNILRGFTEKVKLILHQAFMANNFKHMTEQEFVEMIERKVTLMMSLYENYFTENYFDEIFSVPIAVLVREFRDKVYEEFTSTIKDIFIYARNRKLDTEHEIEIKKKELENYVKQFVNEEFILPEDKV